MTTVHLIVGTTMGASEYIADALLPYIEEAGLEHQIHNPAELAAVSCTDSDIWLVVTSTHGAGDFPESIQSFVNELTTQRPSLRGLKYGVIALGDSCYDTFCEAGIKMDVLLQDLGGVQTCEPFKIDIQQHAIPEDAAEIWIPSWLKTL